MLILLLLHLWNFHINSFFNGERQPEEEEKRGRKIFSFYYNFNPEDDEAEEESENIPE